MRTDFSRHKQLHTPVQQRHLRRVNLRYRRARHLLSRRGHRRCRLSGRLCYRRRRHFREHHHSRFPDPLGQRQLADHNRSRLDLDLVKRIRCSALLLANQKLIRKALRTGLYVVGTLRCMREYMQSVFCRYFVV